MNFHVKKILLSVIMTGAALFFFRAPLYAQNITLTKNEFTLNELFSEIRQQKGYDFVFTTPQFNTAKKVTVKIKNATLKEILDDAFDGLQISYVIRNKTIVITDRNASRDNVISGFVGDYKDKKPLPMVTIAIKGTKSAVQTNIQGRFRISLPDGATSLEIRCIGYKTLEYSITPNATYTIYLQEDQQMLNETIVTGIFDQKAGSFTGASLTLSGAELKKVSSNNVFAAVAAFDPAFRIVPNNIAGGNINQLPEIQMRGANSFPNLSGELSGNPNAPLFILDGFEATLQRIVDLDMNLISSVTLLKDASATAIYGSRGANGVMVVTTVKPKAGKIQITFNNDFRLTTPDLSVYNLLNAEDKLNLEQRAGVYAGGSSQQQHKFDVLYNQRYKAMKSGVNTDWLSLPVQNGYSNRSSLYLQGGDEAIRYGLQFSGDLQSGVMKGQDRKNYSAQFDLNYLVKKIQFNNSIRIFQNTSNESPYGDFSDYVRMNPYWAPYGEDGKVKLLLEDITVDATSFQEPNPLYDATLHSVNKSQYFGLSNNFQMRYNVAPTFYMETSLSLNKQNGSSDQFYSAQDSRFINETDLNRKGSYTVRNENSFGYESLTTANLNMNFGRHQLFSNLGFNISSNKSNYYSVITEGFPFDRLDNLLFAAQYEQNGRPSGDESTVNRLGLVYSGSYTYDNRFLANVSVRRDGSSQYGADKRYGTFWSTGIGWNIHNEKFFTRSDVVNRLKIRASYGSTGSLNIPAYSAQSRYNFGTATSYYGELGATLIGLGNEFLSWQNVYKGDVGVDLIMFKEKLDVRLDLYRENTRNSLTQITLAPSTGFSNYSENLGQIQNTGFEFSARYKILEDSAKGLLWSVNVNGFTNKNILKKLSNKLKASNEKLNNGNDDQVVPNILLEEGQAINTIYVVRSLGVDPATGSEIYLTKNGKETFVWNAADKVPYGISQPKWNGNFGTNFMYKGFDLNLIFNYQYGGQLYNQTLIDRVESVDPHYNVDRRAYNLGWSGPGDVSQYTKIGVSTQATRLTSRFVQDDNNLTLSSASLGYNFFKKAFLKKIGIRSLQVTAITNDLFRVSTIEIERGTSNPFARTYSLSFRVGF
jgi:TonB-linked SusC/RagA family outer membrane protein